MRKIFLLGCVCTATLVASAMTIDVTPRLHTSLSAKDGTTLRESKTLIRKSLTESELSAVPVLKATHASEGEGIEGLWDFQFGDYYTNSSANDIITVSYEAKNSSGNLVIFNNTENKYPPFVGRYDAKESVVTFSKEKLSESGAYYIFQDPINLHPETGDFDYLENITGTYNQSEGTLTFIPDVGIMWSVYADDGEEVFWAGFLYAFDFVSASRVGDLDASWKDVGEALFMDGWLLPGFGIDQTDPANQYYVPLQQNLYNENIFRLVDPYHIGPMATYNQTDRKGYIQFDVSDPNHVVFSRAEAGFANKSEDFENFYCYNMLGNLLQNMPGYTGPELAKALGDQIPYTTYKDGVVSLNYIVEDTGITYDVNFGTQNHPSGGYIWLEYDKTKSNMVASITFPDLNAVEKVDYSEDAVEEYFDLTGRRLSAPAQGQIIIVRKGSKAEKRVF